MNDLSYSHIYRRQEMRFWKRKTNDTPAAAPSPAEQGSQRISEILKPSQIIFFESPTSLSEAYSRLVRTWDNVDHEAAIQAILEREKISPTLIDAEMAVPHARLAGFGPLRAALGICPQGFSDPDLTIRVRVVLLFVGDLVRPRECLAFLSNAAAVFGQEGLQDQLLQHSDRRAALDVLRQAEFPEGRA